MVRCAACQSSVTHVWTLDSGDIGILCKVCRKIHVVKRSLPQMRRPKSRIRYIDPNTPPLTPGIPTGH